MHRVTTIMNFVLVKFNNMKMLAKENSMKIEKATIISNY